VSYRLVLVAAAAPPLAVIVGVVDDTSAVNALEATLGARGALWLLASLFWALLAAVISWFRYRSPAAACTG
jgi:hypothetical protein